MRRRLGALVGTVVATTGRALAHAGEDHGGGEASGGTLAGLPAWFPALVFLLSGIILGTVVYLDHTGELDRRLANAGVAVGALGILVSLAFAFI